MNQTLRKISSDWKNYQLRTNLINYPFKKTKKVKYQYSKTFIKI